MKTLRPPLALLALAGGGLLAGCAGSPEDSATPAVDTAPGLTVTAPLDGAVVAIDAPLVVAGRVVDEESPAAFLSLLVTSDVDGELARGAPAADGTFAETVSLTPGVHHLAVTVEDPAGNTSAATLTVDVGGWSGDEPPSQPVVRVTPDAPVSGDAVSVAFDVPATDPEGASVTYTYAWSRGDEVLSAGASVPAGIGFRGDVLTVVVTPSDGGQVGPAATASVTVGNAPPAGGVATLSPAAPEATDAITCAVAGLSDYEGDPLTTTYAWEVNGVAAGGTSNTLAVGAFADDDAVQCFVTVSDGVDATVFDSPVALVGHGWAGDVSASDAWITLDGATTAGGFGKTIALVGDMDGDARSELAVGASGENGQDGAVYLFAGADLTGPLTTADAIARWDGAWTDGQLGGFRSLAAPGDLDDDGRADLWFAAADADSGADGAGEAYLVYGGGRPGLGADPLDADWILRGDLGAQLGARLATGDADGDGLVDLVAAAPSADVEGNGTGAVGLFYGDGDRRAGEADLVDADWLVHGDVSGDGLGWTAKFVGDVDGDGVEDLALAAVYADPAGSESGVVALVPGGGRRSGQDRVGEVLRARLSGDAAGDRLGYDTVGGVDLDDDGVGDLLVAAYQDDAGATDAGAVYAFLGGPSWAAELTPEDADATVLGSRASGRFGHVMSVPGDLDGDGADDLVIGALYDNPSGLTYQGAAYVLLTPDWGRVAKADDIFWRAAGQAANDLFGDALSVGRGDLDGDGSPDFAVGAQGFDGGASGAGRVYVWRGR